VGSPDNSVTIVWRPDSLEDLQHFCKLEEPTFGGFTAEVPLSDGHEDGRWANCLKFKARMPMKSCHEQNMIPKVQ
jgi:hypothetical protein